jgi:TatD DNase family protein
MIELTDTHCHIHEAQYDLHGDDGVRSKWLNGGKPDPDVIIDSAHKAGVNRMICVGTTTADSELAVIFAYKYEGIWASIGIHPHEAADHVHDKVLQKSFADLATKSKVVAVGECGLDYYYEHSPKADQQRILRFQIELALKHDLPMIFHVRDAFDDFWPIFEEYEGIRGVIHSFTADSTELKRVLAHGLYVGLNGIMTFTKRTEQLDAAKAVPLASLLLETDSPFLTPAPQRGTICEPKHARVTAEFLSRLRGESLEVLSSTTTQNAQTLFGLS